MNEVIPIVKGLSSPDIADLDNFSPASPDNFGFLVQVMFGPSQSEGEESFGIIVCTTVWLAEKLNGSPFIDGSHHLIVREFNLVKLRSYLDTRAKECAGPTWNAAACKLSRIGKWEFEDYVP